MALSGGAAWSVRERKGENGNLPLSLSEYGASDMLPTISVEYGTQSSPLPIAGTDTLGSAACLGSYPTIGALAFSTA